MRILIIEEEKRLANTLADILNDFGYNTNISYDGMDGLEIAKCGIHDAIILDVMLPSITGYEILAHLRNAHILTPVLILTAKSELSDRVKGLDAGADYYLTKPFENEELLACLRTILRKTANTIPDSYFFGDLTLTPSISMLSCRDMCITVSAKEMEMMRLLIQNHSQYLPKQNLLLKIWGYDSNANANNVEAYISFLRKKLSLLKSSVCISVMRNIGYKLEVRK